MVLLGKGRGPKFATLQKQPLRHPNTKEIEEVSMAMVPNGSKRGRKRIKTTQQLDLRKYKEFKEPKGEEIYYG